MFVGCGRIPFAFFRKMKMRKTQTTYGLRTFLKDASV